MVFIKKVDNADAGDADHVGGNDWDKLDDFFADVSNAATAKINSTFEVIASKFKIRDASDKTKEIVNDVSAITTGTTRTITYPDENINLGAFPVANLTGILADARMPNLTGDVTTIEGAVATTIAAGVVDDAMLNTTDDAMLATIQFVIDGGGSAITTGVKGFLEIPFNCTIERQTTLADQTGSIVIDIWKDTYANYPPTVADTITASAKPTISSGIKDQDAILTGWTTSISAGDIIGFNVDSITTVERVTISLKVRKT